MRDIVFIKFGFRVSSLFAWIGEIYIRGIMPLGGASNKAQRAVVDKKAKKKGGSDDEDVQAFKKKQMEDKKASKSIRR